MKQLRVYAEKSVQVEPCVTDNCVKYTFTLTDDCIVQSRSTRDHGWLEVSLPSRGNRNKHTSERLQLEFRELFANTTQPWSKKELAKHFDISFEEASDTVDELLIEGWLKRNNYELTYVKNRGQ